MTIPTISKSKGCLRHNIIVSGKINSQGKVIEPTKQITIIDYGPGRFINIRKASKILIRAELATTDQASKPIKLYADYFLGIKLGLLAGFKVDFSKLGEED